MRIPGYISPSALSRFEKDPERYYLESQADAKVARVPQAEPAGVGSAFDAEVKADLEHRFFGKNRSEVRDTLFEKQVEPQNRDFCDAAGKYIFEQYQYCGAYQSLLDLMDGCSEPQFEFDSSVTVEDVPFLGKPDCKFIHRCGLHVILDWKVNGFCSRYAQSPAKGYMICRDCEGWTGKRDRYHNVSHKLFEPKTVKDVVMNGYGLENVSIDWADQLSIYGWAMGESVGDQFVTCIDQIVSKPSEGRPLLRVATHRCTISAEYQRSLLERAKTMWEGVNTGEYLDEMVRQGLETQATTMVSDNTPEGEFFAKCYDMRSDRHRAR